MWIFLSQRWKHSAEQFEGFDLTTQPSIAVKRHVLHANIKSSEAGDLLWPHHSADEMRCHLMNATVMCTKHNRINKKQSCRRGNKENHLIQISHKLHQKLNVLETFSLLRPKCNRSPVSGKERAMLAEHCSHYSLFSLQRYSPSTGHFRGVNFPKKPTSKVTVCKEKTIIVFPLPFNVIVIFFLILCIVYFVLKNI